VHSPHQVTQAALTVSLDRSESAQTYIKRVTRSKELNPRDRSTLGDCLEEVNASLDRVRNLIRELKNVDHVKGQEFVMHTSNVQTRVSSALTNENTCMDGFSGGRVQKMVRPHIIDVAHVTSNALALNNHFAEKHR
nr:21 kDa protein-like [Tanacetum cinerariifolium]